MVSEKKKKSLMEEIAEMKNPKPTQVKLSAVCCILSTVCYLLSAVCCLLPTACCLLSAACCLLPAPCSLGPDDTSSNFPYTPPTSLGRWDETVIETLP
jgi:hypothetical protein